MTSGRVIGSWIEQRSTTQKTSAVERYREAVAAGKSNTEARDVAADIGSHVDWAWDRATSIGDFLFRPFFHVDCGHITTHPKDTTILPVGLTQRFPEPWHLRLTLI